MSLSYLNRGYDINFQVVLWHNVNVAGDVDTNVMPFCSVVGPETVELRDV